MARPVPRSERRFYAEDRAIGRFGMRVFAPALMPAPHWHGHIEANLLTGGSMTYRLEQGDVEVPPGRLVLFWASHPHQLVRLTPAGDGPMRLANMYLPLDLFLFMPHIPRLQVALLSGGMVILREGLVSEARIDGWYRDYRSGDPERREVLFMEVNALLRRALLGDIDYLVPPRADPEGAPRSQPTRTKHVVAMLRYIMENLSEPMTNADVAQVTGLHETYALSLFTQVMRMPMRRFIIRMRLLRARALLLESSATVATVAIEAGFPSISQFYDHFGRAYGVTPQAMREGRETSA
jgi:AraC-like DNA-binding protein